jgi:hypothetical protein
VHENMIGVPFVGQLFKAIILDVPALVAETHYALGGNLPRGQRGPPNPVTGLGMLSMVSGRGAFA